MNHPVARGRETDFSEIFAEDDNFVVARENRSFLHFVQDRSFDFVRHGGLRLRMTFVF
jgi:hypothetical protein